MCVLVVAAASISLATAAVIGDPQLVSVNDAGGNGPATGNGSAISADGRWVAFTSTDDLTGTPTAGVKQIYVRDTVGGRTLLVSASATGGAADAPIDDPVPADHRGYAISGDGRYVVFATTAANLTAGDPDGLARDVFRKDLRTGAITLVSRAADGASANGPVGGNPDISFDGTRVAYETGTATNLWAGDIANGSDIVVNDLVAGTSVLASANATGAALTGPILRPAISADGRVVAFEDNNMIKVRDLATATTTDGPTGLFPDLSGDGHVLVFKSMVGGIFRSEPVTASPTPVAVSGSSPGVSADGTRVVFDTLDVLPGDGNSVRDVYVRRLPDAAERVSQLASGAEVNRASDRPAMSADGGSVAFDINDGVPSRSLATADTDGAADVLVAKILPTDTKGPSVTGLSPADGTSATTATIGVSGVASDPSGVVAVTVNGFPALLSPTDGFDVEVPLAVGAGTLTVRAVDGAGRVSERLVPVTRTGTQPTPAAHKARARSLRVYRAGGATRVRFVLDAGATGVTVRLWRRVVQPQRAPTWTPVNSLRKAVATRGRRTALVSRRPLQAGIYQVRVTVVSAGGVAVGVIRHAVARRT